MIKNFPFAWIRVILVLIDSKRVPRAYLDGKQPQLWSYIGTKCLKGIKSDLMFASKFKGHKYSFKSAKLFWLGRNISAVRTISEDSKSLKYDNFRLSASSAVNQDWFIKESSVYVWVISKEISGYWALVILLWYEIFP